MIPEIDFGAVYDWADCFDVGKNSCALDRLGAALFVNCQNPRGRLMALFSAYLDASGNSVNQPFVIVTGYIANWVQWKLFESQWRSIHEEFNVDLPFHMSDFFEAHLHPLSYALQKKCRRDYIQIAKSPSKGSEFLKKLTIAQMGMVNCGVSCIIDMDVYNEVSDVLQIREIIPPYALGARACVSAIRKWEQDFNIETPVELIFEKGDLGQGEFTELMVDEGNDPPIYKKKDDFAGLQAADHYAWEQAFFLKKQLRQEELPPRTAFQLQLNLIPKIHVGATTAQLISICEAKGIKPRPRVIL